MEDGVFKMLLRGASVVVSRPAERAAIALKTHGGMGHFGVQRIIDRLQKNLWWHGMGDDVVVVVKSSLIYACVLNHVGS